MLFDHVLLRSEGQFIRVGVNDEVEALIGNLSRYRYIVFRCVDSEMVFERTMLHYVLKCINIFQLGMPSVV